MAKDKKSVLIYVDWISIFEELSDDEAGKLVKHLFRYVNDKNPEAPDRLTKLLFEPIKQTLKRDLVNYETTCNKNRDNALIRWNKLHAVASDGIKPDAKHADSDIDSDSDSDIDKEEKEEGKKLFKIPERQSVIDYFESNGYKRDAAITAFNWYDTHEWKDRNGNPVVNWKNKCRQVWFKVENKRTLA